MAGIIVVLVVLVVVAAILSFPDRTATDTEFLLFEIIFIIFLGVAFADAYLATRPTELVVRFAANGIDVAAGEYSFAVPWGNVKRLWVVRSGSRCPILCIAADDLSRFVPRGIRWRLKTSTNRRLFGTPLVTPLVNTGLSESGLLDAARSYHQQSDGATNDGSVVATGHSADARPYPASRGFRNGLVAGLMAVALVLAGVAWLGAVALVQLEAVPEEVAPQARGGLRTVAALALALAATLVAVQAATRVYRALVPLGDVAGRFPRPVLRVGPEGVEHIVRGRSARLPWPAVQRVYLAGGQSGSRFVCVTTADPLALVPRARNWSAKAKQNEQKYGASVAVSLAASGLTEEDLLNAVRHYSGGQVTVG